MNWCGRAVTGAALSVLALACAEGQSKPGGDDLAELNKAYCKALRWKNYTVGAKFWLPTLSADWLELREAEEDLVNLQGLEIRRVRPVPPDARPTTGAPADPDADEPSEMVEVRIRAQLFRNDTLVVQKHTLMLVWEQVGGEWFLIEERWKPLKEGAEETIFPPAPSR